MATVSSFEGSSWTRRGAAASYRHSSETPDPDDSAEPNDDETPKEEAA